LTEALSRYLARNTVALPPLSRLGETTEALAALSMMVGQARIVAIGESFHHTHEQLLLRQRLVTYLVSRLGFTSILLEAVKPGRNPIDAFVRGGAGEAEDALVATGARMWRNAETASLMRWARSHNERHPTRPIAIHGLDVLAIGAPMRAVLAELKPDGWQALAALSTGFDIDGRADQAAYNELSDAARSALHRIFDHAPHALSRDPAACEAALVVRDALEMLKAGADAWTEGFPRRDRAMADAASRLIASGGPRDRYVILSHNTHIAALTPETAPAHPPMGAFLRERYGDDYFALGAAFGSAKFDQPIYGVSEFAAIPGAADQAIAALGHPAALADLRQADQNQRLRLQGVGVGPLPYTEYPSCRAFDALAYVNALTNARQLIETDLSLNLSGELR
jgi:erythromycin esterase